MNWLKNTLHYNVLSIFFLLLFFTYISKYHRFDKKKLLIHFFPWRQVHGRQDGRLKQLTLHMKQSIKKWQDCILNKTFLCCDDSVLTYISNILKYFLYMVYGYNNLWIQFFCVQYDWRWFLTHFRYQYCILPVRANNERIGTNDYVFCIPLFSKRNLRLISS